MLKRYRLGLIGLIFTTLISLSIGLWQGRIPLASAQSDVFNVVWETVNDNFFDPDFNGVDWAAMKEDYQSRLAQTTSQTEKAILINQMLGELQTSHTHLYTPDEPAYYQLLGIFYPRSSELQEQLQATFPDGSIEYVGIGAVTVEQNDKTFIKAVLDGSPAATAGLQKGDQLLSVEGEPFQPIESFLDKAGQSVTLQVQRSPNPDSQQTLTVVPQTYDGITMFLDAMADSIEIIEASDKQIGYVHIWSYAGDQYQQKLVEELIYGQLREADALILDLREGWGGAPATALYPFTARGPSVTNISRDRQTWTYNSQWDKPVVMLINEGSRSAKEILAYSFQQYDIGPVVGSPTPGAVVGGTPFIMPDSSLLYVAVVDVYVDETVRLEGVGVVPDVEVPAPLAYAAGADPQKEQAIATALDLLNTPAENP
ncbi:MAG: S41 family peptidase [Cyanobacteria bacterium P01_C01_bin.120]